MWSWILFAQDAAKDAAKDDKGGAPGLLNLLPWLAIGLVAYILLLSPARKQRQEQANLLKSLKKNDEVVTHSGIIGVVINMKEGTDEVTIKSDETKLRILKAAIARVNPSKENTETK